MMRPSAWNQIMWFSEAEFEPYPHKVAKELVMTLDQVRSLKGSRITLLEAYAEDGHADYSYHYIGLAADIYFQTPNPLLDFTILSSFRSIGAIGFYPFNGPFWHIDLRFESPRTLWVRDKSGDYLYGVETFFRFLKESCDDRT